MSTFTTKVLKIAVSFSLLAGLLPVMVSASKTDNSVQPGSNFVSVGSDNLHYTLHKTNTKKAKGTFVVMHGAWMNSKATNVVSDALSEGYNNYNVVQLDLPSHGLSTGVPNETIEGMASTVAKAIKKLEKEGVVQGKIVPVGWSMGGSISMQLALDKVVKVDRIVLLNSAPEWQALQVMSGLTPEIFRDAFFGVFIGDFSVNSSEEAIAKFSTEFDSYLSPIATCMADLKALLSFNIVDKLKKVNVPVLIISGDKDEVATLENQHLMASKIKKSTLALMEGETHSLLLKQPGFIMEHVTKFVK